MDERQQYRQNAFYQSTPKSRLLVQGQRFKQGKGLPLRTQAERRDRGSLVAVLLLLLAYPFGIFFFPLFRLRLCVFSLFQSYSRGYKPRNSNI